MPAQWLVEALNGAEPVEVTLATDYDVLVAALMFLRIEPDAYMLIGTL